MNPQKKVHTQEIQEKQKTGTNTPRPTPRAPADFETIAAFLHEVLEECKAVQAARGKMLKEFTM